MGITFQRRKKLPMNKSIFSKRDSQLSLIIVPRPRRTPLSLRVCGDCHLGRLFGWPGGGEALPRGSAVDCLGRIAHIVQGMDTAVRKRWTTYMGYLQQNNPSMIDNPLVPLRPYPAGDKSINSYRKSCTKFALGNRDLPPVRCQNSLFPCRSSWALYPCK